MAVTIDQLIDFLKAAGVRYLLVPDQPAVALGMTAAGRHFLIHAVIEADGSLMQFRTTGYALCPHGSEHAAAVRTLLNELNFRLRMVKFTIDPADGEIVVFTDLALLDSMPTSTQIMGIIAFVMERLRECAERVDQTIRTGIDPGEPEELLDETPLDASGGGDDVIT